MTRSSFSRVQSELDVSRTSAMSTTIVDISSILTQILTKPGSRLEQTGLEHVGVTKYQKLFDYRKTKIELAKDNLDPSRLIFEINVGREHITTSNLNLQSTLSRFRNSSLNFRVVVYRIRFFPTLISEIKWLGYGLPLRITLEPWLSKTCSFLAMLFVENFIEDFQFWTLI